MADLSTKYLGLNLKNPIIVGSSPLTATLDSLKKCEDAGVGAVVLKSIFEEQIEGESDAAVDDSQEYLVHADAYGFMKNSSKERAIDEHLTLLENAKKSLQIPVIASINCRENGSWIEYINRFIACGADAIELNHYIVAADRDVDGSAIEKNYLSLVKAARKKVSIPLSLKMGSSFSSLSNLLLKFDQLSIDGVVLFNRFYSPDIDTKNLSFTSAHMLSSEDEYAQSLRWTALMSEELRYDICASTGIYTGETVVKQLLAGAKAVQLCSALMKHGLTRVSKITAEVSSWMDAHEFTQISDFNGQLAQERIADPSRWERTQYMRTIMGGKKD
ncbi:dihydroorotate dehydrogenase-like protein [Sphaerochaeta sp. PS]|uniref:dihydroorotate dehydrogenase-like protein n=1 Tax=Sphaerochaeta sp. PS TaxID=3076336 RepID=UPI0028A35B7A|nr:dihydroorotate dehydrogenase-like protein [Sphaerochaeta sp. PS]MDT4761748.1 dihydroorotate dehydrogenase-like protein [Sphaerochaeta sp. PS]